MMLYRFLIVDDTHFMRKMAADSLKQFDYEVAGEATNGKDAIEKYKELTPDIVLMDLTMPEMNGVDAIKEIIHIDPAAVILVCSSSNQKDMINEAIGAGAKGYLTKPFKPDQMEEVIRKYAIPHIAAAKNNLEVAAALEVEENELAKADNTRTVYEKPVETPPILTNRPATFSNFVMSFMYSWKEELEGVSSSYTVTCTEQENKLLVEWIGNNQEKQSIQFSIQGFKQLAGWLDQQAPVRKDKF